LAAAGLASGAEAATVHFTFGLTREVEACWERDGALHYRAAGQTYRTPLAEIARVEGECGETPRPAAAARAPEGRPEPGPTDARLSAGVVTLPPAAWVPPYVPGSARTFTVVTVTRVFDGDTIEARFPDGHVEIVRYVGINGPEVHRPERGEDPGAREAWAANRAMVEGRSVELSFDAKTRDRFGRLLAYVWAAGTQVNAELVRLGHAVVVDYPEPVRFAARFRDLERQAQDAGRGLWADEGGAALARDLADGPDARIVVSDAPPGSIWLPPGRPSGGSIRIIIRGR
jgi:micrococcal nuclease